MKQSNSNATKAIFSVSPKQGAAKTVNEYGLEYVSQRARAATGLFRVVSEGDDFFGSGSTYRGAVIENPTWGKLLGEATRMLRTTGDEHHQFLENARIIGTETDEQGRTIGLLHLSMGS